MLALTVEKARSTMRNFPNPPAPLIRMWPTTPPSDSSSNAWTYAGSVRMLNVAETEQVNAIGRYIPTNDETQIAQDGVVCGSVML